MTLPWIIAGAAAGLLAGPPIRAVVFARSTAAGLPPRSTCPACSAQILPGRRRWLAVLPVTGRCPACRTRIGPYPLAAEAAAGLALAVAAARATSVWELAALAWLILIAVPLAFTDLAVHRLPDPLTAAAFTGTLALLTAATLTSHQPGHLARAAIAAALACFYLALCLIRPGEMGLGDAKIAATIGLVLGWTSWQALLVGTFAGFALAAVYGGVLLATHRATRSSQLPLGPFILLGALAAIAVLQAALRVTVLKLDLQRGDRGCLNPPGSGSLASMSGRHHRSSSVTMSAGAGSKGDGRPSGACATGTSVRMRASSRHLTTVAMLSRMRCPVRPVSLPEAGRSSRRRPPWRRRAAVTGPTPGMPLIPSDGSPARPARQHQALGGTPRASMCLGPMRR
jgi:leader peptidase (prepilin peptidase)/N-methyltransferase